MTQNRHWQRFSHSRSQCQVQSYIFIQLIILERKKNRNRYYTPRISWASSMMKRALFLPISLDAFIRFMRYSATWQWCRKRLSSWDRRPVPFGAQAAPSEVQTSPSVGLPAPSRDSLLPESRPLSRDLLASSGIQTSPTLSQSQNYKSLKSARARYVKATAKKQCHTTWSENVKTTATLMHYERKYAKTDPALYNEIANRHAATKIAQLWTEYRRLNRYLHHFGIKNTPYYKREYGKKTMEYCLLKYQNYKNEEKAQKRSWNRKDMSGKTTRRSKDDNAYARIHQDNR
jgi:hypothetical protein